MRGGIAAACTSPVPAILDAEGAGAGPGGQVPQHGQGKGPGELVQLLVRQAIQAAGKEIGPPPVLLA